MKLCCLDWFVWQQTVSSEEIMYSNWNDHWQKEKEEKEKRKKKDLK